MFLLLRWRGAAAAAVTKANTQAYIDVLLAIIAIIARMRIMTSVESTVAPGISAGRASHDIITPPEELDELLNFSSFLEQSGHDAMLLGPDGEQIPVPYEVYNALVDVVSALSNRHAITIAPYNQQLTTQAAADFLNISRPTLIKLLDEGEITYAKLPRSRHRRIFLTDLIEYKKRLAQTRRRALEELTADAEKHGLYDIDADFDDQ